MLFVRLKDKILQEQVVGPVNYIHSCDAHMGEMKRLLKAWFLEHKRPSSTTPKVAQHIHIDNPKHEVGMYGVKLLAVESKWIK